MRPSSRSGSTPLRLNGQIYSQWEVPNQRAAGWHQSSAPLGQPGNTVLNGHHNVYGEVFHYLVALQPGDIVTLEFARDTATFYIVAQTMTLAEEGQPIETRQANARWILPTEDERVTLITCWPYNANTHRLVVIALPLAGSGGYRRNALTIKARYRKNMIQFLALLATRFSIFRSIRRVRRNHGLEHATIHVLSRKVKNLSMAGRSTVTGFYLYGNVTTEEVESAVREALQRMRNGEHGLAIHPNCGTGLVTAGLLTSLATLVGTSGMKSGFVEKSVAPAYRLSCSLPCR